MSGNNSNKKRYFNPRTSVVLRVLMIIPAILVFLISCSGGSPTVIPAAVTEANPTDQSGILIPQITMVYPAGLTGISPTNPGIITVFSRPMENDLGEMTFSLELRDGAVLVPYTLNPSVSSSALSMQPIAPLAQNHTYTIRIYRTCYENDFPTHTLDIANLPASITATAVTSDYVEYQFTTGPVSSLETVSPTFSSSIPANGSINLPPSLTTGYIEFLLNDNATPMIDPSTVNTTTVVLYNVTDSVTVDGWIELAGLVNFERYYFRPSTSLDYGKTYTLTISTGSGIRDLSDNVLPTQAISFSTIASSAVTNPNVTSWTLDAITSSSATISWHTDSQSIAHIEIDTGTSFTAAEQIAHNSSLGVGFSATFNTLAPNTDYSIRIYADNDTSKGPTDYPFDTNVTYNYAFHTPPDTTDGATGNYLISNPGSTVSNLSGIQMNLNESFVSWTNGTNTYIQYFNSSSGTPDTWGKWTAGGAVLFNASTPFDIVSDGLDGVIATRTDGTNVRSNHVRDNGSALENIWGGGTAGILIYSGSPTSVPRAAITYGGWVTNVTPANYPCETYFIYDPSVDFIAPLLPQLPVAVGDYIINESRITAPSTVSSVVDQHIITTSNQVINITDGPSYRISGNTLNFTANQTANQNPVSPFTISTDNGSLNTGDLITDLTSYSFITSNWGDTFSPYRYDVFKNCGFTMPSILRTYPYHTNGSGAFNALYDPLRDFIALGVAPNDIVLNVSETNVWDKTASVYNGQLLTLLNPASFIFDTDGENYRILRLGDSSTMICEDVAVSFSAVARTITHSGVDFDNIRGVDVGDIVYNPAAPAADRYAKVLGFSTSVTPNDTLILSSQPITAVNQPFIVFRKTLVSYVWSESGDIYISSVSRDTGASVYPAAVAVSGASRNPYIVEDLSGNALIIYETTANDILVRLLRPSDASTLAGAATVVPATSYIKKVLPDGLGGAWVLYTAGPNGTGIAGIAHVTKTLTVYNPGTIPASSNPDMTVLNANGDAGFVYERTTVVGTDTYSRLRFMAYSTTALLTATPVLLRSADSASSQLNPRIGPDGSGGAHISWIDTAFLPANPYSLFAQHLNAAYTRLLSDNYCITIPYSPGNTSVTSPYELISLPLYYKNGAITPYSGMYVWIDGRTLSFRNLYLQNTPL